MLSQFLISELFALLLVFCRLGAAFVILPGFAEGYVPARVRLLLALMFSLLVTPLITTLPAMPASAAGLVAVLLAEIITGLFLGALTRMLLSAVHMAGTIIAFQTSLSTAITADISQIQGQQDTTISNLMTITAITLFFATDLHHLMLRALVESYGLFTPGQFPLVGDMANHAARTLGNSFIVAMQMAGPHIVIGLTLYLGAGIISRLMPTMQIFFIMLAPQLVLGFFVLMVVFGSAMMWYLDYFETSLTGLVRP